MKKYKVGDSRKPAQRQLQKMSQQDQATKIGRKDQGTSSATPTELPTKRKRGRPRKDDSLPQMRNSPVVPSATSARSNQSNQNIDVVPSANGDDPMVGQVVTGVLEGAFDAGYILTVRVGDSDTLLRGCVFTPGRFIPINVGNDIAPSVRMFKRRNIPIPVCNPQAPSNGSNPQPRQNDRPVPFEDQVVVPPALVPSKFSPASTSHTVHKQPAPLFVGSSSSFPMNVSDPSSEKTIITQTTVGGKLLAPQVLPSAFPPDSSFILKTQSTPVAVTVTDNIQKNDRALFLGKNIITKQALGPEIQHQLASGLEHNEAVEQCKEILDSEASPPVPGHKVSIEASKDSNLAFTPKPVMEQCNMMQDFGVSAPLESPKVYMEASKDMNLYITPKPVIVRDVDASSLVEVPVVDMEGSKDLNLDLAPKQASEDFEASPLVGTNVDLDASQEVEASPIVGPEAASMEENQALNFNLASEPVVGQCEVMQDFETPPPIEGAKFDMEASQNLNLNPASKPSLDIFPDNMTNSQVNQVQHQADGPGFKPSHLVEANLKTPNLNLQLTSSVAAKSASHAQLDILMDKQNFSGNIILPQDMQLDHPDKISSGDGSFENGGKAVVAGSDAVERNKANFQSISNTNQSVMILQEEASLSEPEFPAKGSVDTGMLNPQVSSSSNPTKDMDCVFRDAL